MATREYTNANQINLGGAPFTPEEGIASEAITPGHLIEDYQSAGNFRKRKHSTAKGFAKPEFAVEDSLQGRPISTAYAQGELVFSHIFSPGARVLAWLKPGTSYVHGDKLISNGDGTLQKISGSSDLDVIAICQEALDLSASGAVATRCAVQIK